MRNAIMHSDDPLRECLEEAYISGPYLRNTTRLIPNDPVLPLVLDKVYPCSDIVKIDYQIPGCAPSGDIIYRHAGRRCWTASFQASTAQPSASTDTESHAHDRDHA